MVLATPNITHHLHCIPAPGPGHRHRRRLLSTALAAVRRRDEDATTEEAAEAEAEEGTSPESSLRLTNKPAPAALISLPKDYSHMLFRSECLEVLGMVDLESLRKRPRLTVGVTVKASVVLPVLVVLAVLYLTDVAKGVVDWTDHQPESEDVGE